MTALSYTHTRTREARARACVFYFMNYITLVRQRHPCRCYLNILHKYNFYLAQLDGFAVYKEGRVGEYQRFYKLFKLSLFYVLTCNTLYDIIILSKEVTI